MRPPHTWADEYANDSEDEDYDPADHVFLG